MGPSWAGFLVLLVNVALALAFSFDLPVDFVLHTDCPHYWRYAKEGETEEEFSQRLADSLEALIVKEGPENIAAFIAEPVMGAGGVIPPPAGYWERIQVRTLAPLLPPFTLRQSHWLHPGLFQIVHSPGCRGGTGCALLAVHAWADARMGL